MIHLKGTNLYLYERPITHTKTRFLRCSQCKCFTYTREGAIDTTGWLAQKSGGKVRRHYCPQCSMHWYPSSYAAALRRIGAT